MRTLLVLVAACKAAPAPPTIANRVAAAPPGPCLVRGYVHDAASGEPLAGVTIMIDETAAISDEDGAFTVKLGGPPQQLDAYYLDTVLHRNLRDACGKPIQLRISTQPSGPIIVW